MKSLVSLNCLSTSSFSSYSSYSYAPTLFSTSHWGRGLCLSLLLDLTCSCFSRSYLIISLKFLHVGVFTSWWGGWHQFFWRWVLFRRLSWCHRRWFLVLVSSCVLVVVEWLLLDVWTVGMLFFVFFLLLRVCIAICLRNRWWIKVWVWAVIFFSDCCCRSLLLF